VGLLSSAPYRSGHGGGVEHAVNLNNQIVEFCEEADIGMKQYLAPYTTQQQWKAHFGAKWELFERRKHVYDPLAILAPGQRIFPKASLPLPL
jgi:cytokinin dehydrogenase